MAWEWVAPVATAVTGSAGIFFTWMNGKQARDQVERMTDRQELRTDYERVLEGRQSAYLTALNRTRLSLKRRKYKRAIANGGTPNERETASRKLEALDAYLGAERLKSSFEFKAQLEAYGSDAAREWLGRWEVATDSEDSSEMQELYFELVGIVRSELNIRLADADDFR